MPAETSWDKTFGDGSVQKLIDLPTESAVSSRSQVLLASGKAIQDTAITPNVLGRRHRRRRAAPTNDQDSNATDENKAKPPSRMNSCAGD